MSDPVSTARTARESLRQGLAALQSPGVPPQVMDVAEPVAQAMGALHQIEASGGAALPQQAPLALDAVRRALAALQAQPQIPAVGQAVEAVAGSLGLVHQLAQAATVARQAADADVGMAATMFQADAPAAAPHAQQAAPRAPAMATAVAPPGAYGQPAPPAYAPPQAQGYGAPAPAAPYAQPPQQAWPTPAQAAPPQAGGYGAAEQPAAPPPPGGAYGAPPQAQAPVGDALRVEAELGAHSTSNFYKGLSGNDVIESGGVFIATYQIPDIGQALLIKVSLPGGYEFEADGVVHWTRDAPHSTRGVESPPGYGARFTRISQEGRQLVYRYVRNREPIFYDDL